MLKAETVNGPENFCRMCRDVLAVGPRCRSCDHFRPDTYHLEGDGWGDEGYCRQHDEDGGSPRVRANHSCPLYRVAPWIAEEAARAQG